jgi:hypothetical protein
MVVPNELVRTDYNWSELFANPHGYVGVQAGMVGLSFSTHMLPVLYLPVLALR